MLKSLVMNCCNHSKLRQKKAIKEKRNTPGVSSNSVHNKKLINYCLFEEELQIHLKDFLEDFLHVMFITL